MFDFRQHVHWIFITILVTASNHALAASVPKVPEQYQRFFVHYVDKRSFIEKALNAVGLTNQDVGRSFALIAGTSEYPNLSFQYKKLTAASEDVKKITHYLQDYEFFDEIIVLTNKDVTYKNMQFFLRSYFPNRLRKYPKSRFLFAYSGHGLYDGSRGYLVTHAAKSIDDKENDIPLDVVRVLLDDIVKSGHHVIVLLNACHSGCFLTRPFSARHYLPRHKGGHAITAGGSRELAWHRPELGTGSVFFEKLLAGLHGQADVLPKQTDGTVGDGIITVDELAAYIKQEVQIATDQRQNPLYGDISQDGSLGGFFFLARNRQIKLSLAKEFSTQEAASFSVEVDRAFSEGLANYRSEEWKSALRNFQKAASLGSHAAMLQLGNMYSIGLGIKSDHKEAIQWFRKAADGGEAAALLSLGVRYFGGQGVQKDFVKAAQFFQKASEAGLPQADLALGMMYHNGRGVEKDTGMAINLFVKAAEGGISEGALWLGGMYARGEFVEKDQEKALGWYHRAAELQNVDGMVGIGELYWQKKDFTNAYLWFRMAEASGSEEAKIFLEKRNELSAEAHALFGKTYKEQGHSATIRYLLEGVELGISSCAFNLGMIRYLERNYNISYNLFLKAALYGHPDSQYMVATMYSSGQGVQKNIPKSNFWMRTSAKSGGESAIKYCKQNNISLDTTDYGLTRENLTKYGYIQ